MQHVLYMPDGNRRFAQREGISLDEAYMLGGKTLRLFADFFLCEKGLDQLTWHAMSKYTHERTDGTLNSIYPALIGALEELRRGNFLERNKIRFLGVDHSGKVPRDLEALSNQLEIDSRQGSKVVRVLLGYDLETDERQAFEGSRTLEEFKSNLLIPPIDLVVRTTEMRPSGGPVYAMPQAQMILLQKLNPEVTRDDLQGVWQEYQKLVERRRTTNPAHRLRS